MQRLLTSETSDEQLRQLANRLCLRLDGILFKSELAKIHIPSEKRNYSYIVHLEQPQHWTALFIDNRNKRAYWFNSFAGYFGDVPQSVVDFVKRSHCILYQSDIPVQSARTGMCGQYCVLWLCYMNRKSNDIKDFNDYLKLFKSTEQDIKKYKEKNSKLPY